MKQFGVGKTLILVLCLSLALAQSSIIPHCLRADDSLCQQCISGYSLIQNQCIESRRNLQTTPITGNVDSSKGKNQGLKGITTSQAEIRSTKDGSLIQPKTITPLNVDGMVGNFFSVNVGNDPNKVQLIFNGLTDLSNKKAGNGTGLVSAQKKEANSSATSNQDQNTQPNQDLNLTKVNKQTQEPLNLVPVPKGQNKQQTPTIKTQNNPNPQTPLDLTQVNKKENQQGQKLDLTKVTKKQSQGIVPSGLTPATKVEGISLTPATKKNSTEKVTLVKANQVEKADGKISNGKQKEKAKFQLTQVNKTEETNNQNLKLTPVSKQNPLDLTPASKQTPLNLTAASKKTPNQTSSSQQTPLDLTPATKQTPLDLTAASKKEPKQTPLDLTADSKKQTKQTPLDLTPASKQTPLDLTSVPKINPPNLTPVAKKQTQEKPLDLTQVSKNKNQKEETSPHLTSASKVEEKETPLEFTKAVKAEKQQAALNLTKTSKVEAKQKAEAKQNILSEDDIEWIRARRVDLPKLLTALRLVKAKRVNKPAAEAKCIQNMTFYQLPEEEPEQQERKNVKKYIQETMSSIKHYCKNFYEPNFEFLCLNPLLNLGYKSIIETFPEELKDLPILNVFYDYCCGGRGKNIRFFFLDDSQYPTIKIIMSSVVIDRIKMAPYPVIAVVYSTSEQDQAN